MEKSYIGMDCCIYCGEPKGVLLDQRMRKTLDRCQATSSEPCDKCKEEMAKGFTFIVVNNEEEKNPLGVFIVVSMEVVRKSLDEEFLKSCTDNVVLITPETAKEIGLEIPNGR